MPLDLVQLAATERDRAVRPLDAPIPGVDPEAVVARIVVRGEPQPWQRPIVARAQVSEVEARRLVDALLTSPDPPSETVRRWREDHNRLVRTITPQETIDAEELIRAHLRVDMDARGISQGSLAGAALGLRCRFHMGHRLRPDLDNLVAIVMEAATGSLVDDDRQIVEVSCAKVTHDPDPRTEIVFYRAGVYR